MQRTGASVDSETIVMVPMPKSLAVGVGHSLRALAQRGLPNAETAEQLKRVGDAMVEAANAKAVR